MDDATALPGPEYLELVGRLAYTTAGLEWLLLGDLPRLQARAPELPDVGSLATKSSGRIASKLQSAVAVVTDGNIKRYYEQGAAALARAAEIRNHVLHARPATVDGDQRLYRWTERPDEQFAITSEWLQAALDELLALIRRVDSLRPAGQ